MKRLRNLLSTGESSTTTSGSLKKITDCSNTAKIHVPRPSFEFNKRKVTPVSFSREHSIVTEANPTVASPQVNVPIEVEHSIPTFNPIEFQSNLKTFLEEKFEDLDEKRRKDKQTFESNLLNIKTLYTKKNTHSTHFKFKSNKIQFEFLADLEEDI